MPITRRHTLYGVELDTADMGAAVVLGGVKGQLIEAETEVRNDTSSGDVYPTHLAMVRQDLRATFRTTDLATALANIGLTGLKVDVGLNSGVNFYGYALAEGSTRQAGSTHRKYNVKEGIIVPTRITCDHQGDAVIEYLCLPTYDETNDPIVITDLSAVPTQGTDTARFSIGSCKLGDVVINHITSFELDFGVVADQEGADSDKFATHVAIQEIKPVLRLRGRDIEWLKSTSVPLEGLNGTNANTKVYLRKRAAATASGYVANGTAQHISFVMQGLVHITTLFDGQSERNPPAEVALEMPLYHDGTNAPITINTATAIT